MCTLLTLLLYFITLLTLFVLCETKYFNKVRNSVVMILAIFQTYHEWNIMYARILKYSMYKI